MSMRLNVYLAKIKSQQESLLFTFLPLGEEQPMRLVHFLLKIFKVSSRDALLVTQALVSIFVIILIRNEKLDY
jgi:hypothetical protein